MKRSHINGLLPISTVGDVPDHRAPIALYRFFIDGHNIAFERLEGPGEKDPL